MTIPKAISDLTQDFAGRSWVAREVADWIATGTERFFAITGAPGTEKSALAAWLAGAGPTPSGKHDSATLDGIRRAWAATHFCVPGQGGTVEPLAFGSDVAGALARALDGFLPALATANNQPVTAILNIHGDVDGTAIGIQIKQLVLDAGGRSDAAAVTAVWQSAVRRPLQQLKMGSPLDAVSPAPTDEAKQVSTAARRPKQGVAHVPLR